MKRKYIDRILVFLQLFLIQSRMLVEGSVKNIKSKTSAQKVEILKEQSSNQISAKEDEKLKPEEQLYYLPLQTVFGETHTLAVAGKVSTTSPPHLSINPAPIETTYQKSTSSEGISTKKYYSGSYQSQCVSETPVIELESRFLLPSTDTIKESVIMSGHLEIASKTSSIEETPEVENSVSKPSIILQGTQLHSHTIADL